MHITNFTSSWKDGLAFNAIIHAHRCVMRCAHPPPSRHRPDLVDYASLKASKPVANMNFAFDTAEKYFGLPSLLDPHGLHLSVSAAYR